MSITNNDDASRAFTVLPSLALVAVSGGTFDGRAGCFATANRFRRFQERRFPGMPPAVQNAGYIAACRIGEALGEADYFLRYGFQPETS